MTDISDLLVDLRAEAATQEILAQKTPFDEITRSMHFHVAQLLRRSIAHLHETDEELVRYLEMEILSYWQLAKVAYNQPNKLSTLGDTCAGFHGRAEGLHQVLFRIDPEAARTLEIRSKT
jgi:hypothetical protein